MTKKLYENKFVIFLPLITLLFLVLFFLATGILSYQGGLILVKDYVPCEGGCSELGCFDCMAPPLCVTLMDCVNKFMIPIISIIFVFLTISVVLGFKIDNKFRKKRKKL